MKEMIKVEDVQVLRRLMAAAFCAAVIIAFSVSTHAEVIEFSDAPFEMPPILVVKVADRDFSIADFGAREGVKATGLMWGLSLHVRDGDRRRCLTVERRPRRASARPPF